MCLPKSKAVLITQIWNPISGQILDLIAGCIDQGQTNRLLLQDVER